MDQLKRSAGVGRNEPCSCGSEKKFKKCCGSAEKHNAKVSAQREIQREIQSEKRAVEHARIELKGGATIETHGSGVIRGSKHMRAMSIMAMASALLPDQRPLNNGVGHSYASPLESAQLEAEMKRTGSSLSRMQQYLAARGRRGR